MLVGLGYHCYALARDEYHHHIIIIIELLYQLRVVELTILTCLLVNKVDMEGCQCLVLLKLSNPDVACCTRGCRHVGSGYISLDVAIRLDD